MFLNLVTRFAKLRSQRCQQSRSLTWFLSKSIDTYYFFSLHRFESLMMDVSSLQKFVIPGRILGAAKFTWYNCELLQSSKTGSNDVELVFFIYLFSYNIILLKIEISEPQLISPASIYVLYETLHCSRKRNLFHEIYMSVVNRKKKLDLNAAETLA